MPQQFDPTIVDYIQRTDPPSEIIYFDTAWKRLMPEGTMFWGAYG